MREVVYRTSSKLPCDIVVALVEGESESVILVDEDANAAEIVAALNHSIVPWVREEWLHIGRCADIDLATG